jgi:hypothetical protein
MAHSAAGPLVFYSVKGNVRFNVVGESVWCRAVTGTRMICL